MSRIPVTALGRPVNEHDLVWIHERLRLARIRSEVPSGAVHLPARPRSASFLDALVNSIPWGGPAIELSPADQAWAEEFGRRYLAERGAA